MRPPPALEFRIDQMIRRGEGALGARLRERLGYWDIVKWFINSLSLYPFYDFLLLLSVFVSLRDLKTRAILQTNH